MSEPSLALQRGIYSALTSSSAVNGLIGNRIYDRVTSNATFPYVRIGLDQTVAEDQDCVEECVEVFTQVDVFSRSQGKVEAKNIAGVIVRALNTSTISLESAYDLQDFRHADTRFLDDPDGLSTHAVLSFRALIETAPNQEQSLANVTQSATTAVSVAASANQTVGQPTQT